MRSTAEKQKTAEESKKRGAGPGLGNAVQGKSKQSPSSVVVTPLYYVQPAPPPNYLDDDDVEDGDGDVGGIVGLDKTTSHSGLGASSAPLFSEDSTNSGLSSPSRLKRGIDSGGGDGDDGDDDEYVLV